MRSKFSTSKARRKHITSADVGRYLKHLAALHRDPLTGNVAMSDALNEIAAILIAAKAEPAAFSRSDFKLPIVACGINAQASLPSLSFNMRK